MMLGALLLFGVLVVPTLGFAYDMFGWTGIGVDVLLGIAVATAAWLIAAVRRRRRLTPSTSTSSPEEGQER